MKNIMLILLVSPLFATGVITAWSLDKQGWIYIKTDGNKKEACYSFSGGVCHKKVDVTNRIYKEKTSSGYIYVIREK